MKGKIFVSGCYFQPCQNKQSARHLQSFLFKSQHNPYVLGGSAEEGAGERAGSAGRLWEDASAGSDGLFGLEAQGMVR